MSDDDLLIAKINPLDPEELEKKLRPLFKGYTPQAQGICLASLTALFVAGHQVKGNPKETLRVRQELLGVHFRTIVEMIPAAEEEIRESQRAEAAKPAPPRLN